MPVLPESGIFYYEGNIAMRYFRNNKKVYR